MTFRVYRKKRSAAPLSVELQDLLTTGLALLSGGDVEAVAVGGVVDLAAARTAWERHRGAVLAAWAARWPAGQVPTCWAARMFDDAPLALLTDPEARRAAHRIEMAVLEHRND